MFSSRRIGALLLLASADETFRGLPSHYVANGRSERERPEDGGVSDLYSLTSHHHPKLIAVDKQPDDDVMHLNRFGKADRLAGEPLDTGPQGQMPALALLGVSLARGVLVGSAMTAIGPPIIRVIVRDPQGLQQRFQLPEHVVCAPAQTRGPYPTAPVLDGLPQPPLLVLLAHKGPQFIDLRFIRTPDNALHVPGRQGVEPGFVDTDERRCFLCNSFMTVVGLIFNT